MVRLDQVPNNRVRIGLEDGFQAGDLLLEALDFGAVGPATPPCVGPQLVVQPAPEEAAFGVQAELGGEPSAALATVRKRDGASTIVGAALACPRVWWEMIQQCWNRHTKKERGAGMRRAEDRRGFALVAPAPAAAELASVR